MSGPILSRSRYAALYGPTVGDRLIAKHVDWAWYAGGWSNATGTIISRLQRSITETTGFLNMFAKLLRAVETRKVRRLGGTKVFAADVPHDIAELMAVTDHAPTPDTGTPQSWQIGHSSPSTRASLNPS